MREDALGQLIAGIFLEPLSPNADYDLLYRAAWFGELEEFARAHAQCAVGKFTNPEWYALLALIVDNNLVHFLVVLLSGYVCMEAVGADGKTMWHLAVEQQRTAIIDCLMQYQDRFQQTHRIADYAGNTPAIFAFQLAKNAQLVEDKRRWNAILHQLITYDDAVFTDTGQSGVTLQYEMLIGSATVGPSLS
jgi:hypothetical protein